MPRVRFGDVHVFNNYYSSSGDNYCIRAGYHSRVLVENNHFQGVGKPHEIGEDSGMAEVVARGNTYTSTRGARDTHGTAFTSPYTYTADDASSIASAGQSGAGPH
jgi:pectate lyase